VAVGSTTTLIKIFHVDHDDFVSPPIATWVYQSAGAGPVVVREPTLRGALPNPVEGPASIVFALPRAADVDLALYDLSGREVERIARGHHEAGTHTIAWSPGRMASGVYFLRLTTPDAVRTRRISVMSN
jgi:hypothetical protein